MNITFPLYHGTSTVFLEDIILYGLAGINPIEKLKLYAFSEEIFPIITKYMGSEKSTKLKFLTLKKWSNKELETSTGSMETPIYHLQSLQPRGIPLTIDMVLKYSQMRYFF